MRTLNPVLKEEIFSREARMDSGNVMTLSGTINKCFTLVALCFLTAILTWSYIEPKLQLAEGMPPLLIGILAGGAIGGLILALITFFKKTAAPITAPLYAIFEGAFLGTISLIFEMKYPGIVIQAVLLTFGVLFVMLTAYRTRIIKVTEKFRMGVVAATGAIFLLYFVGFIMSFFGTSIPMIHESGVVGIGFSVVVVIVAALNLVLDFDMIERGSRSGAPRYMEWFAGFALLVTLIWLYIEILILLSKIRRR